MQNRTYRYFSGNPLYPFGYGLSYSKFSVISADREENTVRAEVVNHGPMAGEALVQIYGKCDSPYAPLHPRLCGFRKIALQPGEKKTVSVPLDPLTDTVISESGEEIKADGYTLYAGLNQPDELSVHMSGSQPIEIKNRPKS